MPAHLRVFIYKTAIRPALAYGNETWPVTGILIDKFGSCEMRMLSYRIIISLEEHRRDEETTSGAKVMPRRYVRERDEDIRRVYKMRVAWLAETVVE